MINKLTLINERYNEINQQLMDPEIVSDQERYTALMKEHKHLTPIVEEFNRYCTFKSHYEEAESLLKDGSDEIRELAELEYKENKAAMEQSAEALKV